MAASAPELGCLPGRLMAADNSTAGLGPGSQPGLLGHAGAAYSRPRINRRDSLRN